MSIVEMVFGAGLFLSFCTGGLAILYFFLKKPHHHDYWCHRDNLAPGEDHGNQEPHV